MPRKLISYAILVLICLGLIFTPSRHIGGQTPQIVILIVDEFEVESSLVYQAFERQPTENDLEDPDFVGSITSFYTRNSPFADPDADCALSLEGLANMARTTLANGDSPDPHGVMVMSVAERLISEAQSNDLGSNVVVEPIPIDGLTTNDIADLLFDRISSEPDSTYIINMSFGIVPCTSVARLMVYEARYQQGNYASAMQGFEDELTPLFNSIDFWTNDPLYSNLPEYCGTGAKVVPVAAAGNFGWDFPLVPAAWSNAGVISVSGSDGGDAYIASPPRASWSNWGAVLMPGWTVDSLDNAVSGTSFAAPRLAALLALYAELEYEDVSTCSGTSGSIMELTQDTLNNATLETLPMNDFISLAFDLNSITPSLTEVDD